MVVISVARITGPVPSIVALYHYCFDSAAINCAVGFCEQGGLFMSIPQRVYCQSYHNLLLFTSRCLELWFKCGGSMVYFLFSVLMALKRRERMDTVLLCSSLKKGIPVCEGGEGDTAQ